MTKKTRILFLALFAAILAAVPLGAFDWGGFVSADAGVKGPANPQFFKNFTQSDRLTLWMRTPLPNVKDGYFTAEGFYDFKYSHETNEMRHLLDISLFKLSMTADEPGAKFTFNIGRYGISDLSGFVFAQASDGMELRINSDRFESKLYGGYTGFLNSHTVPMNLSRFDDGNRLYQLAPPAVIGSILVRAPRLFKQQTLACEIAGAGMAEPVLYTTLSLNGPLHTSLFYAASSTMALTSSKTNPVLFSNLSRFELTAYFPFMSSFAAWNTVFATGKTAKIDDFKSFSIIPANLSSSLTHAGHVKTGLTGSIKPINALLCTLNADVFFNVMNSRSAKGFAGVQWQTAVRWHICSDLQLSASAGQFFTAFNKKTEPYTTAVVKVLYSF